MSKGVGISIVGMSRDLSKSGYPPPPRIGIQFKIVGKWVAHHTGRLSSFNIMLSWSLLVSLWMPCQQSSYYVTIITNHPVILQLYI